MIILLGHIFSFILLFALYSFNIIDATITLFILGIIVIVQIILVALYYFAKLHHFLKGRYDRCVSLYRVILEMIEVIKEFQNSNEQEQEEEFIWNVYGDLYDSCITLINRISRINVTKLNDREYANLLKMYKFCSEIVDKIESDVEKFRNEQDN